jgi:hypothetical protein
MPDEPDNLTLRMLRQMDGKLDTVMDRVQGMTSRIASIEDQLVGVRTELGGLRADVVRLEHRMDNFDTRLLRIAASSRSDRSIGLF